MGSIPQALLLINAAGPQALTHKLNEHDKQARFPINAAGRDLTGAAREAAYSAGQAAAVAHVAARERGATAYAIRAVRAAAPKEERDAAGRLERQWRRARLPGEIRELVLDDQRLRKEYCWFVFDG